MLFPVLSVNRNHIATNVPRNGMHYLQVFLLIFIFFREIVSNTILIAS